MIPLDTVLLFSLAAVLLAADVARWRASTVPRWILGRAFAAIAIKRAMDERR
ncbi:MAG: hypothetical protein ABI777_12025 [Betaproteobacteria bacterium]